MKFLRILMGLSLFLAIFQLPYDYYILLRWFIAISVAIIVFNEWKHEILRFANFFLIGLGILFNPFTPFYFSKTTWVAIDTICGILLIITANMSNIMKDDEVSENHSV